ncbi:MAG: hypothetical protein HC934_13525 [Acaryochloridaceae cyanobacterium SU_2_1]|nr:hypothetical protein [Acaryochloridaceae cyanobacterium SU_2_1]
MVELNAQGQVIHNQNLLTPQQLQAEAQQYLKQSAKGVVLLKPHPNLSYEQVLHQLELLRTLGRDRVSLILE